ncbi:MAG: lysophospholipase L1-like esterase, partial [Verrucomicrobiales bacterium]
RRLMLENFTTLPGESKDVTFIVNTRRPAFGGGREVRLKDREHEGEWIAWDEKLTLEFIESTSAIQTLKIEPAPDLPTIFLLGDSTMCDQPSEPYASWGQMLPRFFESEVAVANHGESGESYSASSGRGRIDKIIDVMKLGDYLFLQFAHNDMKERGEGKGAFLNFKEGMIKHITAAREKGGIPVLITPMHRRRFDDQGKIINTFGDYPEAVRQTAKEQKVPLIDLLAMSAELYESLGPEGSAVLFKESDGTHHNNYGAYQLAKCVVNGIRDQLPDAARGLKQDLKAYAPGNPDPLDSFRIPASSTQSTRKPDGK